MPNIATAFNQPGYPPATLSHIKNVRYLHLGTSWVQGAMDLRKPDAIALEYVQMMMVWMLFQRDPRHIVQLGLGSAALSKFCYHEFPAAQVTAIELNPNVIAICGAHFGLPPNDARLQVLEMDALDYVLNPAKHGLSDILQVDLYDEEAQGPALDSLAFYQGCADCLQADGILTLNLFGQPSRYDKSMSALAQIFDAVASNRHPRLTLPSCMHMRDKSKPNTIYLQKIGCMA
jgi:spermidine synthase